VVGDAPTQEYIVYEDYFEFFTPIWEKIDVVIIPL